MTRIILETSVHKLDANVPEPVVVLTMHNLSVVWHEMFPEECYRQVRLLITRVGSVLQPARVVDLVVRLLLAGGRMKSSQYPAQELRGRALARAVKLKVNPRVVRVQEMRRKRGSCSSAGTVTLA